MYTALTKKQQALLVRLEKAFQMERDGDNGFKDALDYEDIYDAIDLLLYVTGRT